MKRSPRWNAIRVVTRRELFSTFYGLGIYAMLTIAFLLSVFIVNNYLSGIAESGVATLEAPLDYPLFITVVITGIYLALCAAMSISRERDWGTLEVLFYGPIDSVAYVASKYLEQMIVFLLSLGIAIVFFLTISGITGLGVGMTFWATALGATLLVSCLVAFGIFLSTMTRKALSSIIIFLGLVVVFLALDLIADVFTSVPNEALSTTMRYVRTGVVIIDAGLRWISPFAYLSELTRATKVGTSGQVLGSVLAGLVYTLVFLLAAIRLFAKKGVKR